MKIAIFSMSSLIVFTALGSINQLSQVPYIVLGTVAIVTTLIAINKINTKHYPIYVFGLALSLLYQTSMLGSHIVGVDIHTEYFVTNEIIKNGWNVGWANNSNTSIVLAWITPFFNWIGIDPVWTFKAICPIACSGAPLVLYYALKRVLGEKRAYFSCLFLITMPMFTMEVTSIVKSQWAYLFVACVVFFLTSQYRTRTKVIGITLSATMTILTHYSVGTVMLYYAIAMLGVTIIANLSRIKWVSGHYRMPLKYTAIVTVSVIIAYVGWFGVVGQGSMLRTAFAIVGNVTEVTQELATSNSDGTTEALSTTSVTPNTPSKIEQYLEYTQPVNDTSGNNSTSTGIYLNNQSPLIRTAIGLDFNEVPIWGKMFRTIQFITQALMVIGLFAVLARHKHYLFPQEYTISLIVSFMLLGACIFVPFLTTALSTTRFYAITLFFIAPLAVIGIEETVRTVSQWTKRLQSAL